MTQAISTISLSLSLPYLSWYTINVEFHHVFPTGIIHRVSIPVLGIDDATTNIKTPSFLQSKDKRTKGKVKI